MSAARLARHAAAWTLPVLLITAAAAAAAAAQQPRPMTLVDLIEVPSVSDPQLSPDGTQVLYVRSDADWERNRTVSHVWRVGIDGGTAVQLTNGRDGESSPRWSPDGARIAFLAGRDEAERTQIYLIPNGGGEAAVLTDHPTAVSSIAWSPDGEWIYYLAPDEKTAEEKAKDEAKDDVYAFDESEKNRHLWHVAAATGERFRITGGDFHVRGYELSRDGSLIVQQRAPSPLLDDGQRSELWLTTAAGGEERRLTENGIAETGAQLSPDNRRLLFVANSNGDFEFYYNDKIFLLPAEGGRPEVLLPELPHDVNGAAWSADGRAIYFLANTGVRQELFRADVATRQVTQLTRGDHTVSSWRFSPEQRRHVFTVSGATNAGDVWTLAEAERAGPSKVTAVFDYLAREFRLPRQEAIRWRGQDGVEVEGLLFYPLDYREGQRYPLVVQTHGGPASSDRFGFPRSSNSIQKLTAMGYMVFKPNYRGSTGYGDDFLRDMVPGYFNQAHLDVMAGVDHLIERGLADGERMAKMGWSAGGHMTNKIITFTDRFKAASSGAGAVNWISMYGQSDTRVYRTPWFGGTPWQEDAPIEMYWNHSALKDVSRVKTPTLVLVGENDLRVPMPQSVELFRALRSNAVPTHLYVAPREGHGWRELRHRLFKSNVELDWFERWVMGRSYTWEEAPKRGAEATTATDGS